MQEKKGTSSNKQELHIIILLILAGESIFILPFVLARVFRPTFLAAFELNNLELGTCFSVYGIVAFLSYLFGGPLADRFRPKYLMSASLFLTALGGVYMASFPSYTNMKILFGYWGFTTIFLFWSAMIKTTRLWGGESRQGIAYGLLDGGRGLVGALFGVLGLFIFSTLLIEDQNENSFEERREVFSYVILISSLAVGLIGFLVLFFLKPKYDKDAFLESIPPKQTMANVKKLLAYPSVWMLMIIIVCAYVAYKITDDFSLYANQVLLFNELDSAKVGSFLLFIRPITGVSIGLLADRSRSSLWMVIGFLLIVFGSIFFVTGWITANHYLFFFITVIIIAVGTYAVRTLYFAAMEEAKIPLAITGTAVGLLSLIGYTPDIFAGPIMGYLLDNSPGILGHQYVFLMLFSFALVGLIAAILFYRLSIKKKVLSA